MCISACSPWWLCPDLRAECRSCSYQRPVNSQPDVVAIRQRGESTAHLVLLSVLGILGQCTPCYPYVESSGLMPSWVRKSIPTHG